MVLAFRHLDFDIWNLTRGIAVTAGLVIAGLAKCSGGVYLRLGLKGRGQAPP